jgi:hypothetical protein
MPLWKRDAYARKDSLSDCLSHILMTVIGHFWQKRHMKWSTMCSLVVSRHRIHRFTRGNHIQDLTSFRITLFRTIRRCFHNFILFQHPIPLHIQYSNIIMTLRILILPVLVLILFWGPSHAQNGRFVGWNDRFTYEDQSIYRSDGFVDWSPIEWDRITCNEGKKLDECMAYIDKWESGRGWKITRNDCDWCPEGSDQCGRHHQSPVNLLRETGLPLDSSNDLANECIDLHWIKYEDSLCTFQQLKERNAFTIERHALRTSYPLYFTGNAENAKLGDIDDGFVVGPENTVHLDCPISGRGPRFPRMGKSL